MRVYFGGEGRLTGHDHHWFVGEALLVKTRLLILLFLQMSFLFLGSSIFID